MPLRLAGIKCLHCIVVGREYVEIVWCVICSYFLGQIRINAFEVRRLTTLYELMGDGFEFFTSGSPAAICSSALLNPFNM